MDNIKQDTIDLILSDKTNEAFWYFELGRISITAQDVDSSENQFMNSFFDKGQKLWESFQDNLKNAVCDVSTRQPKEIIKELSEGDLKDLVVNIIGIFVTSYDMTLAIAIPLTALVLKKGLYKFCS